MTARKPTPSAPCPRCLALAKELRIRTETVQPIPEGAGPRGLDGQRCCFDCQAADNLVKLGMVPDFEMARIAVGNDRQEQYRLPGVPLGLVQRNLMRPSKDGDLDRQHAWLDAWDWFGIEEGL